MTLPGNKAPPLPYDNIQPCRSDQQPRRMDQRQRNVGSASATYELGNGFGWVVASGGVDGVTGSVGDGVISEGVVATVAAGAVRGRPNSMTQ